MGFFRNKRSPEFEALVDQERKKIRKDAFASAAKMDAKAAVQKEVEAARFAALPRTQRAKARLQKAGRAASSFFGAVGNASNVVSKKLESAEKRFNRFNQKAKKFNGQNSSIKGGKQNPMGGSLGDSIYK